MAKAREFLKAVEKLVLEEDYCKALGRIESEGLDLLESLSHSPERKALLLLLGKVYYFNRRYDRARPYLSELEETYPDIYDSDDFVILKSQLLLLEGETERAREIIEISIEKDRPRNEYYLINYYLGKAHFWNGDYLWANRCFQSSYRYYADISDHYMLGKLSYMLGYTAFQRCFFDVAESYYKRSLENFKIAGKSYQLGAAYHMMGILDYRRGRYSDARNNLLLAGRCFKRCSNTVGIVNTWIGRARVSLFIGDYKNARRLLLKSYDGSRRIGYKRGMALSAEFLGETCYHCGEYRDSLRYLKEAEELAVEIAPRGDIAVEVYRRLGEVYITLGEIEGAECILAKALELARHLHDEYELGSILRAYGLVSARKGDTELSRSFFNEAIVTLKLIKESFELARTYHISARTYEDWCSLEGATGESREEFLIEARNNAVEAMHLFSSCELNERAGDCERLVQRLESEHRSGKAAPKYENISFDRDWLHEGIIVARSRHMKDILSMVRCLAPSMIPVLITGETGTGKEIVAKILHRLSDRTEGPFVAVNCASIQESVFESEMFGHRKGAFTGAYQDKIGLIEQADGGTLFLDEISELSGQEQAKLLRVLQDNRIRRVGETRKRHVDIRIVSASNKDIDACIESGRLRTDFYYRIAVESIKLEPLRKRRDDLVPLFAYYMKKYGSGFKIEAGVLELLESYHWPGNVRELINLVKTLSLLVRRDAAVMIDDLPSRIRNFALSEPMLGSVPRILDRRKRPPMSEWREDPDNIRQLILSSLNKHGWNRSAAARELGVGRTTLYRRMKELGLFKE